jgi:hypothetical protein
MGDGSWQTAHMVMGTKTRTPMALCGANLFFEQQTMASTTRRTWRFIGIFQGLA